MNKYDEYLEKLTSQLKEKIEETDRLETPSQQLNRMREYYTKNKEGEEYFAKYQDKGKGLGRENYYNYLRSRGKYQWKWNPEKQEEKLKGIFEKKVNSPPHSGKKGGQSPWNRKDWLLYEAVKNDMLDYSSNGFFSQKW